MDNRTSYPVSVGVFLSKRTLAKQALQAAQPTPIRPATLADLRFVTHVQKRFTDQLGFLPTPALEWYLANNGVTIANENDTAAGYLLGRPRLRWQPLMRPIYQAAVLMDAQRRHHGLQLLAVVEAAAIAAGQIALQANCAAGLDANEFWAAAGFKPIAHLTPANVRGRDVICWRKPLTRSIPPWFVQLPDRAGHHAAKPVSIRSARHQSL